MIFFIILSIIAICISVHIFPNEKFISITPAGIYGSYTLGIASYIQDNYDINKYSFIGASSGSWNSLICSYKYNRKNFIKKLLKQPFFEKSSVNKLQENLANYFLENYNSNDFDLNKLYISVSEFKDFRFKSRIISNFTSLDDALECCRASCHIPFLTSNNFLKIYRNSIVFDGGFTRFPPNYLTNYFMISANKYSDDNLKVAFSGLITRNFSLEIINKLFEKGYNDSSNHKNDIDLYFNDHPFYINYLM